MATTAPSANTLDISLTTSSKTSSSTTTSASASSTAEASASNASDDAGLSVGAKAGIGIGAAAGAVLFILLAMCLKRRRNDARTKSLQISDPMPGSGRAYAGDGYSSLPSLRPVVPPRQPMNELDMNSRRYEDMLPRHTPRRMV